MRFRIKVDCEIVIEADGVMQADTVWKRLRKDGRPYLMADGYYSITAPGHDYRDRVRHRADITSKILHIGKMEKIQ